MNLRLHIQIFPFPNKIISIGLVIYHISKITKIEMDKEENYTDDLEDDSKWDIENMGQAETLEADDLDDF